MFIQEQNCSPPLSILLIDDSGQQRLQLGALLVDFGHQIFEAASGAIALKFLAQNPTVIDLIIIAIQMPEMDGFETTLRIRAEENRHITPWLPIIFLSCNTNAELIAHGIAVGGDDYLIKPVDTIILKAKIKAMQKITNKRQSLRLANQPCNQDKNVDKLTKLPNIDYFQSVLKIEIERSVRHSIPLSLAFMELDNINKIRTHYGHIAVDAVRCSVAHTLSKNLRSDDNISLNDNKIFCICLPDTDINKSLDSCERYRLLIESLITATCSQYISTTVSVGVTGFIAHCDDINSFLTRAEQALGQAKANGHNRVEQICPWDSSSYAVNL